MIRPATESDAEAIAHVHVISWGETYTGLLPAAYIAEFDHSKRREIWRSILTQDHLTFVYEMDKKIIGFANGGRIREPKHPYTGEIYSLYLLKHYQGFGIGKSLFQHLRDALIEKRLYPYAAWVLASNPSLEFYKKMGAHVIDQRFETIGKTEVKDLQLGWC